MSIKKAELQHLYNDAINFIVNKGLQDEFINEWSANCDKKNVRDYIYNNEEVEE